MKLTALFLVLSLVVLMAEPGEGFIHHIFRGVLHVGKWIHGLVTRRRHGMTEQQQEQLDKRSYDRDRFA